MAKFKGKYRGNTVRLATWDFGWSGDYFVTLPINDRRHVFGKVINGEMVLSEIGEIAEMEWRATPDMRPDMNLSLGSFVVMPDHFHAIITIGWNQYNAPSPEKKYKSLPRNRFGPQSKNLASIMRGFKSAVTIKAKRIDPFFKWQKRYWCHIIFEKRRYHRISNYIVNNPKNWKGR